MRATKFSGQELLFLRPNVFTSIVNLQAQQTYQDAIAAGQSAFLLQESDASSDVFECMVGNLPPQSSVKVTLAYVGELSLEGDGAVKFVYPAVLGQRYGSPSAPAPVASTSAAGDEASHETHTHIRLTIH